MNKNVTKIFLLAAAFFLFSSAMGYCQYYDIGSEKPSVKWERIKSPHFEIIYPQGDTTHDAVSGLGSLAAGYLKKVEAAYGIHSDSVRYTYGLPKRFPLVLHPFNAQSNGVTVWGPRQIDFFSQPPVDIISTEPWDVSLATHEGRHAWQVAHFNRGFFKVLYWVFGDQVIGAASGIYPSRWFLEGDAVVAETQMSKGGRGRSGFFLQNTLKSIVPADTVYLKDKAKNQMAYDIGRFFHGDLEGAKAMFFYKKNRSWDRWRFGSVKAYSPNPYDVGYMINAMARHHSGDVDLSHKILNYEPLHFMSANVVASAFKEYSGKTHREYVKDSLLQEFLRLNTNEKLLPYLNQAVDSILWEGWNPSKPFCMNSDYFSRQTGAEQRYYTEYRHITKVGKDSVVAIVCGYGTPGVLVLMQLDEYGDWKEKVLRPFPADVERLSYHDGKIFWSECDADMRWGQHAENELLCFDLRTGQIEELSASGSLHLPQEVYFDEGGYQKGNVVFSLEYKDIVENDEYSLNSYIRAAVDERNRPKQISSEELLEKMLANDEDVDEYLDFWLPRFHSFGQITSYALNRFDSLKDTTKGYMSEYEAYYTAINDRGLGLYRGRMVHYGYAVGSDRKEILPPSSHIIKDLSCFNGELFFISDMLGSPMLFRMNPDDGVVRIASTSTDVSSYSIDDGNGVFVVKACGEYGFHPYYDKLIDLPIPDGMEFKYPLAEELSEQYKAKYGKRVEEYIAETEKEGDYYKPEPYSKAAHLFKIHSWMPTYAEYAGETSGSYDNFYEESKLGVTAYSQNTLGTMRASAGYSFENRDGHGGLTKKLHGGHLTINYSGWYPVIEGTVHVNDRIIYRSGRFSLRTAASVYIPLAWDECGWNLGFTPALSWSFRNDQTYMESTSSTVTLHQFDQNKLTFQMGAYKMQSIARAQVYPRWGIGGRLAASTSPDKSKKFGSLYSAYAYGYLPGLTFNQGLRLSAGFQRQLIEGKKFWLDNHLDLPRGYTEDFYGRNYIRATADYAVPIYLGDVSLGPIAYLQQLQLIPFIDYSRVDFYRKRGGLMGFYSGTHYQWESRYSFGADVMLKGHFLRIGFPMYIGVRYARTNKPCDYGNSTPATYDGKGGRNYCTLLLGIEFY